MNKILLGKYELRKKLGEGGSSIVYLAWDKHMERYVAVKEEKDSGEVKEDGVLKKEMELLKTLKHPMLPAVYDYFREDMQYLVMEFIQGEGLHNYIEKRARYRKKEHVNGRCSY